MAMSAPGEFQPTPGTIYPDLSNEVYHSLTDWHSSSMLKAALPERYKTGGSPAALEYGTLVHSVVLEPDNLGHYVALDAERIGRKADGSPAAVPTMTQAWKKAVAEAEQDGKTVVAQADWDAAHRIRDAVAAHGTAAALLLGDGASEESVFWADDDGQHRARFDRRLPGAIVDLKTTSAKPGPDSLTRTILDFGYEVSAAHYLAGAAALDLDADVFAWVFVGKAEEPWVSVVEVDGAFLARGRALRAEALRRLNDPGVDRFPGASGHLILRCPAWAVIDDEGEQE